MNSSKPPVHTNTNINRLLESSRPGRDEIARTSEINVLLLGETQSGKSTFVEFVKKYANPNHTIDLSNIGGSFSSCTNDVIRSIIDTNLPISRMVKNGAGSSPTAINLVSLINDSPDVDDFEDVLYQRNIKIIQVPSSESPQQYRFNLFDTPGLNTRGKDEEHIGNIYKALRKAERIHLVLITIGKVPFTPGFQAAIKYYFDMFPEFCGIVAFVHTHFNYKNLHPRQEEVYSHLTAKKGILDKMMGRGTCQHFEIDCDIKSKGPIRIGITQNIIRSILSLASFNQPVNIKRILIMKSPRMRVTDNILANKLNAILDAQRKTVDFKDGVQGVILRELYEKETRLNSLRSEERDLEDYIKEYNTDDLVMLEELTFDEQSRFFQFNKDHSMSFPEQKHIIHKKNILSENVEISKEQGGEGHNFWNIVYRRHSYEDGALHAKLYTTRSSIHREKISENQSKLSYLRSTLQRVENEFAEYSSKHQSEMADIQKLIEKNALYTQLISRLSSERLSPEVFQYLMDKKAYDSESPQAVEDAYLEIINKDGTKASDSGDQKIETRNILLLGETQFGKNTFIELVKKYADPEYIIDFSNITGSVSSYTKEVTRSTIHTDLPITTVVENVSGSNPTEVYLGSLINNSRDFDDFESALNRRNLKTIRIQPSESITQYQFNLFDAPQDLKTSKEDEVHIAGIYQALRRAKDVSLVLITVGMTPFTPGFQAAIKYYFDMFPGFHELTAFVHMHVDYKDLHPSREKTISRLTAKIRSLNDVTGRESCPHFAIDCDLKTTRPIRTCITQNTIHNILYLASSNDSITVDKILIHKSPRMRDIDSILVSKYKEMKGDQTGTDLYARSVEFSGHESGSHGETTQTHSSDDGRVTTPLTFNILVLGEKGLGKSTLIEAIKGYDNLEVLDLETLRYTPTVEVTSTTIRTSLPRFSAFENGNGHEGEPSSKQLDNNDVRRYLSLTDDKYNELKSRLYFQRDQQPKNTCDFSFRLIDTPGLDFTKGDSKGQFAESESGVFASKTFPAILNQLVPTCAIHLVLLVVPDVTDNDHVDYIDFYRSTLPVPDSNVVYVYRDKRGKATTIAPQPRNKPLEGNHYAGPVHILIDKIFIKNDPIRACLARNDISRILELALLSEPVLMQPKKPPFIKSLDDFLEDRYSEVLKSIHNAVAITEESSTFHNILQSTKSQCDEDARNEIGLSFSPMKLIFSQRFENTWDAQPTNKTMVVNMESTDGEITQVDILQHNVEILRQDGGKGTHKFGLSFQWTSTTHGVFDIRIYASDTTRLLRDTREEVTETVRNAVSKSRNPLSQQKSIVEFLERYRRYNIMRHLASSSVVHPDAIQILSICNLDQSTSIDLFECVEKLERAYLETASIYAPLYFLPENISHEINVDHSGFMNHNSPTISKFKQHLLDRQAQTPWTKIGIEVLAPPTLITIDEVCAALEVYYKPWLVIKRVSGDVLSLDSCYTNLVVVEASDQRQKDKEDLKAQATTFDRIPNYKEISKDNIDASIPLEELFDKRKLRDGSYGAPKTILVQGRPGIGKTTFCKKLVHAYQGGLWKDRFDAVLWLPLRQLKSFKAHDLEDLLRKKYFAGHPRQEKKSLAAALAAHKSKVLFILDGLDEVLAEVQTEQDSTLAALLKHILRQEHVVIASRPSGVDTSTLPKLDLQLEIVGFSAQNVKDYLHRALNHDAAKVVQDYIEQTPLIRELVNIPAQLDVICYNWDALPSDNNSLTMTRLYQTMVRGLWRKDAARLQKAGKGLALQQIQRLLPHQIDRLMAVEGEYLSFLAFKGLQDGHKIEFDESTLLEAIQKLDELRGKANQEPLPIQLLDTLKQTSFLHTTDTELDTSKGGSQRAWHFLDLTFQEYFAATWLARHLQNSPKIDSAPMMTVEETKAFIQQQKYNPHYKIVWWMVAGLLQGETLTLFFDILQEAPVNLIGGYHHHLLTACLKESRSLSTAYLKEGRNQLERLDGKRDESTYNILILGETQSGKSTLIQGIRRYIDPACQIDRSTIGGGMFPHTQAVRTTEVTTNLPPYYVYETSKEDGEKYPVDYDEFIKMERYDYEDAINRREGYALSQGITDDQSERKFKLIDTPGLNDTDHFDEEHIGFIFEALKDIRDVHLVLITVSSNVISDGVKDAIKLYANILQNFKGILAFVHTHIKYKDLHPDNDRFIESMEEKKKIVSEITSIKNVPQFMIDCDLQCTRPIQVCITQNTIRNILSLAPFNQPIRVKTMTFNKTPKMSEVDTFLKEKYEGVIKARAMVLEDKDKVQGKVLETIGKHKASIGEKEGKIQDAVYNLSLHESDEMVLFDQKRFEQDWSVFTMFKTHKVRIDCAQLIDHLDVLAHNVEIKETRGGQGESFWEARIQRKSYQHCVFHAKVYVKKRKMFKEKIEQWKRDIDQLPSEIEKLKKELQGYEIENQGHQIKIKELLEELGKTQYLLNQVSKEELDIEIFHELVDSRAYVGDRLANLTAVQEFYMKNRARFEK